MASPPVDPESGFAPRAVGRVADFGEAWEAVRQLDPDDVVSRSVEALADVVYARFCWDDLKLDWANRTLSKTQSVLITVGEPTGEVGVRPDAIPGARIELFVPYKGSFDMAGLWMGESKGDLPPVGFRGNNMVFLYEAKRPVDPEAMKASFEDQFARIERHVARQNVATGPVNEQLRASIVDRITKRRDDELADRQLEAFLNVPIVGRDNPTSILAVDPVKRAPLAPAPQPTSLPFEPEPGITPEAFEEILTSIEGVNSVIERLPGTFNRMPEESLRDILLAVLSNQFGPASGETFSRNGKTDILIPYGGDTGAVFIAECKWWTGPKAFGKAIDQLLGYLTWRDTHASLIVFVRKGSPTAITTKAITELESHAAFKRAGERHGRKRFTLTNATDPDRELHVALLVIPVLAG